MTSVLLHQKPPQEQSVSEFVYDEIKELTPGLAAGTAD